MVKISPAKCQQCPLMRYALLNNKPVWNVSCLADGYCYRYQKKLEQVGIRATHHVFDSKREAVKFIRSLPEGTKYKAINIMNESVFVFVNPRT